MQKQQTFRCTRIAPYSHNCAGRHDVMARQGYYVRAKVALEAIKIMAQKFPEEKHIGFTVECWS